MYYGYMLDSLESSICTDLDKLCAFHLKNRYKFYTVIYTSIKVHVGDITHGPFGNLYGVKI